VCWSVAQFDAAKHLNTHPDLVAHSHNRLTLDKLKTVAIHGSADDQSLSVCVIILVSLQTPTNRWQNGITSYLQLSSKNVLTANFFKMPLEYLSDWNAVVVFLIHLFYHFYSVYLLSTSWADHFTLSVINFCSNQCRNIVTCLSFFPSYYSFSHRFSFY